MILEKADNLGMVPIIGFFYFGQNESYENGYQRVPVDWWINSERKKQFFSLLKEISGGK